VGISYRNGACSCCQGSCESSGAGGSCEAGRAPSHRIRARAAILLAASDDRAGAGDWLVSVVRVVTLVTSSERLRHQ